MFGHPPALSGAPALASGWVGALIFKMSPRGLRGGHWYYVPPCGFAQGTTGSSAAGLPCSLRKARPSFVFGVWRDFLPTIKLNIELTFLKLNIKLNIDPHAHGRSVGLALERLLGSFEDGRLGSFMKGFQVS